jgi:hypothetical protein
MKKGLQRRGGCSRGMKYGDFRKGESDSAGFGNVTVTTIRADLIILGSNSSPIAAVPAGPLN